MGTAPSKKNQAEENPSLPESFNALFTLSRDTDHRPIELGRGAFSTVYLCERNGRVTQKCAAKHFDLDKLRRSATKHDKMSHAAKHSKKLDAALSNTRRGLQVLLNFSGHDSIIKLLNIFDVPGQNLISVMEYAEGGELYNMITARTQIMEEEAQSILVQISSGVVFLHEMGSVHRDIKAENICLVGQKWKLCDFGFACDFINNDDTMSTLCGTKGYAAPEVFFGKPYQAKLIDVFSLGVLSHMIMGGYLPFKDGGIKVIFHPERWSNVSDMAKDFVSQCVQHSTSKRMKSEFMLKHNFLRSGGCCEIKTKYR